MEFIKNKFVENKSRNIFIVVITFVWSMLGHAFFYFNLVPQTDSMVYCTRLAGEWEISLGRFILPIYDKIRGTLIVPWLTGVCTILFISATIWSICEILDYNDRLVIALISGFLSVNVSITEINANFSYATDQYAFAIMCAVVGVLLLIRGQNWKSIVASVVLMVCSLGIYQSEIIVAVMVMLFWGVKHTAENGDVKKTISVCTRCACGFLSSAVTYYIIYKSVLIWCNVEAASSYNSITSVKRVTLSSIGFNLVENLKCLFKLFFTRETITGYWARVGNTILFLTVLAMCIFYFVHRRKEVSTVNKILAILGMVFTPVFAIIVPVMMGEFMPRLYVNYSIFVLYVWLIVIWQWAKVAIKESVEKNLRAVVVVSASLVLASNILYSNNVYSYEKLMYDRTLSVSSTIISELCHVEEYIPGETPVVLIMDDLISNENIAQIKFDRRWLANTKGMNFTYTEAFKCFAEILGHNINFVSGNDYLSEEEKAVVDEMPMYPQNGYIKKFDKAVVIKFCKLLYW